MIEKEYQEAFTKDWGKNVPNRNNELVIIRQIVPWKKIIIQLLQFYSPDKGKNGKSLRILVALLILQKLRELSDRDVVKEVKENRYMQYFCNVPDDKLFTFIHPSLLSTFRKRIGVKGAEIIEGEVFSFLKKSGVIEKDTSLMDSTVLNSNIIYPNDVQLLYKGLKKMMNIAKLYEIPLWWDNKAVKTRWREFGLDKKTPMLKYLEEFYVYYYTALTELKNRFSNIEECQKIIKILTLLDEQTRQKLTGEKHIENRMVSLDDIDARPIKKGKKHPTCEFGSTIQMTFNRQGFMITTENFIGNPNDKTLYSSTVKLFRCRMGAFPNTLVTDRGFRSRDNFKFTAKKIASVFLGCSSDVGEDKQDYCRKARSATEGFIAVAKNLRGFRKSLYWGFDGHRIWTLLSQTAYNLKKLLQLYYQEKIPEKSLMKLGLLA